MKIVIVGSGNAGVWTALHYGFYTRKHKDIEVELIYNPEIDPVPVGQGTLTDATGLLWFACGPDWYHNEIRATPKLGILYENFSKKNPNIFHPFWFPATAMQADPKYLQKYILNSGWFDVKEGNVTDLDTLDADVIFDCRGNNEKEHIEYETLYCPVNSVLLAISEVNDNSQNWTRSVATPDGWTFIIPNTTSTTSYGYLYNSDITPMETAKTNFREVFPEITGEMVNLPFESYLAKEPLRIDSNGRKIILNGNRLAFLEPMEATAVAYYLQIARMAFDGIIEKTIETDHTNFEIKEKMHEIHTFISWHYVNGSIYDTPFWNEAQAKTNIMFENMIDINFKYAVDTAKSVSWAECRDDMGVYGLWPLFSIKNWYEDYINS